MTGLWNSVQDLSLGLNLSLLSGDFCCLLIAFSNSLDPDQDRHNVGPDLNPICLTLK